MSVLTAKQNRTRMIAQMSVFLTAILIFLTGFGLSVANAVEPIRISKDDTALDLAPTTEIYLNQGDVFQVSTAAGADGIVRRIEVRSNSDGHHGDWAVFSLANTSDEQLERVIVAPHFRLVNSQLFWPDLGSQRIIAITPSEGFALDREPSDEADVFRITLNPGSVITFVAELASPELPQLYLWEPEAYKDTVNSFTLYRGIVLGIAGLLALFLTIFFVVRGTAMLPAAAALSWAVLAYICVDFGFLEKLVSISAADQQIWRAGTEVMMAASLVLFLFTYLNLNRWHTHLGYATLAWITGLLLLGGVAIYDPSIASGIARLSFALTAVAGVVLIVYLGILRYDRAILLVPAWALIIAWLIASWMTVTGQLDNDIVQAALGGGLVLIVLLIGFTVMQHAFSGAGYQHGLFSDLERQSLALTGSGDTVWDWDVSRDRVITNPDVCFQLGLAPGDLHGPVRHWLQHIHPDDQDRFRAAMDIMVEHGKGRLQHEFRMRASDGHYHWLSIKARPVLGAAGDVIRCVGTLSDITEQRTTIDRLLYNAVYDNLTGLPNRQLFLDRLETAIRHARETGRSQPTVILASLDGYSKVNDRLGLMAGDNILIVLTRRIRRLLSEKDTLARISGDQFGIILTAQSDASDVADFAHTLLQSVKVPISYAGEDVDLSLSVGLATWVDEEQKATGLLSDAELALFRAKRGGGSRVEPFRPAFRASSADQAQLESDLRRAIDRRELSLVYQPIVRLSDNSFAGFEALMRWDHPKRGDIPPLEFISIAEKTGLINQLGLFAFDRAASDFALWRQQCGDMPIFVSVNLSSAQLLNKTLLEDFQTVLAKTECKATDFKLELTESLLIENPAQSTLMLERLKSAGFSLALDDFGTGYSALSCLTSLPFSTIKIDRSLVERTDEHGRKLLLSIVNMILEQDMEIVAEGISSTEDATLLNTRGCQYGQSFIFNPPLGAQTVSRLLRENFSKTR